MGASRLERFEQRTAKPMLVLGFAVLPLLVAPLLFSLSAQVRSALEIADLVIWGAFAAEYAVGVVLAEKKRSYVKTHLLDLLIVVLPFLRPLRVVRSVRALRLLRSTRAAAFLVRDTTRGRAMLTRHRLHHALLATLLVTVAAALLILELEAHTSGANIRSLGDALWWALATVTTVGYGDRFPVTIAGRVVAGALMLVGIGVYGFLAATLASFFVEEQHTATVEPKLGEVLERLERLEGLVSLAIGQRLESPEGRPRAGPVAEGPAVSDDTETAAAADRRGGTP